jgi:hypothetical protein
MKTLLRIILMIALVTAGFAAGFPIGRNSGFTTGSEWALVQADILAREEGLFMPVNLEEGRFRIVLKQPKHLYRETWVLADRHEDEMAYGDRNDRILNERIQLARNTSLLR